MSFRKGILVHPEELTEQWLDRMAEGGLDTLGMHPAGGMAAHETLQRAIDRHFTPEARRLAEAAEKRGITVEYEAHVMRWLLPASLFVTHPDWFRQKENGERTSEFNLCPSNDEAMEYISDRAMRLAVLLDTGTDEHFYWADDVSSGGACCCPKCRALSPSDQQLMMANAMLRGIRRVKPNAKLCYLAYYDTLTVPRIIEPDDGIFLEFAPIRRDPHAPIADAANARNAGEIKELKELLAFFGTKNSRVLEYWMDNSLYSGWKKPPKRFTLDEDVLRADRDYYASLGFETITSFGCFLGEDYRALYGEPPVARYGEILNGK